MFPDVSGGGANVAKRTRSGLNAGTSAKSGGPAAASGATGLGDRSTG